MYACLNNSFKLFAVISYFWLLFRVSFALLFVLVVNGIGQGSKSFFELDIADWHDPDFGHLLAGAQVVAKETIEAEAKKEVVQGEEAIANEKAASAKAIKDECEGELAVAMPMLEAALQALNTLSKVRGCPVGTCSR